MRISRLAALAAALPLLVGGVAGAAAQDLCLQLESRLAQIDRGASGGGNYRQFDEPITRQKSEIDRATAEARRAGCVGGFLIFQRRAEAKCAQLMPTIDRMRSNLQRLMQARAQAGGDPFRQAQERSDILRQLAFNRCGADYDSEPPQRAGLFATLFGQPRIRTYDGGYGNSTFGTYRTLCVRTCDGFYFPISFSTVPDRFATDEQTCQSMCPGAEAELFTYRNPGEDTSQAVSLSGEPYTALPNAFRFRQEYDKSCTCGSAVAVSDPEFSTFSDPQTFVIAPQRTPPPLPRLRPFPGEDPETAFNRAGGLEPGPVKPVEKQAVVAATGDDLSNVRVVGPSYLYAR